MRWVLFVRDKVCGWNHQTSEILHLQTHLLVRLADGLVILSQFDAGMVWWEPEELQDTKALQGSVQSVLLCWELHMGEAGKQWPTGGTFPKTHTKPKASSRGKGSSDSHHTLSQALLQAGLWAQPHPPQGLLCPRGTHTEPLLHLHLAVKASSSQGNILPMGWEEVGAAAVVLLLYSALSSVCNYPKHRVIRHNLQSLQLFGIPLYWLTDRIGSRMQQIETAL